MPTSDTEYIPRDDETEARQLEKLYGANMPLGESIYQEDATEILEYTPMDANYPGTARTW